MFVRPEKCQKNPRVRKIRVRNSGAGNGCANFMDTWKKCVLSAGKTVSVKFPVFGGGFWGGGGGSADFIFMGARIFLKLSGMTTKWGFGVAMLPVGALCFYQAHFGRTVLPKWPQLFDSVF